MEIAALFLLAMLSGAPCLYVIIKKALGSKMTVKEIFKEII